LLLHGLAPGVARRTGASKGTPVVVSVLLHVALATLVVLVPLLTYERGPATTLSAFFTEPLTVEAAPPPPPPAPGRGLREVRRPARPDSAPGFATLVAVSFRIEPEVLDLGPGGGADGVDGGVDGGVPDGVVGAIVAGLPPAAPPPPARVVRISSLRAPRLVRKVAPTYPALALAAGVSGVVVVEAEVDAGGRVTAVHVVAGHRLLEAAALEAVQQWRYQPLLLSGEPTAFIVTVSVTFTLSRG
jgi:protein TonB